jgi:hypothetical protein
MAHLILEEGTNARPHEERSWEYLPKENPRPITLIREWDKKLVKEVQYSGKSWWIIHRDFISDSRNSEGLPFRITSGRPVLSKKTAYRVVKNLGNPAKSIAVHVGDLSSILPPIGPGRENSMFFNKPGNWAVLTLFDQTAPLKHDLYKLLISWNDDQIKTLKFNEGVVGQQFSLGWRDRITHSCAKAFTHRGSGYEFLGNVKTN